MPPIPSASGRRPPKNRVAGFSLIEVLGALVVTLLLMLSLMPLVGQMLATWARGDEVAEMVERRVQGIGALRADLRHAVVWGGFGRMENRLGFRGSETSMSFPAISGGNGLEVISLDVTNSTDGHAIIRRHAPVVGTTYTAFADPVVMFSGPYRYFFRYYSGAGAETSEWRDPLSFPTRVELNIVDGKGRLSNIPIAIPIIASVSAACVASSGIPGCPIQSQPPVPANSDPLLALANQQSNRSAEQQ